LPTFRSSLWAVAISEGLSARRLLTTLAASRRTEEPAMSEIDRTIEGVEQLYRSITGHPPENGETIHEVIPSATDPTRWVERQMDRLMSLLAATPEAESSSAPLGVWETPEQYYALVDLPGVSREALKVSVRGAEILVEATRTAFSGAIPDGAVVRYREQRIGSSRRLVALPPDANLEHVEAKLTDGVLLLRVPRAATPRAVSVK